MSPDRHATNRVDEMTEIGASQARPADSPMEVAPAAVHSTPDPSTYCLVGRLGDLDPFGVRPWAPGRRGWRLTDVEGRGHGSEDLWCISEVDIFTDLDDREMASIAAAAPMREFTPGARFTPPPQPMETLFILKQGRVRIFRVSPDGRALTTAILTPGTIFGEMLLLGQQMYDNFAEALDTVTVCVMTKADVQRFLLSDARIAARISEILGTRVSQLLSVVSPTRSSRASRSVSPPRCACSPSGSLAVSWAGVPRSSSRTNSSAHWSAPHVRPPRRSSTSTPSRDWSTWAADVSPFSTWRN